MASFYSFQILQKAIKYFGKAENCLTIYSRKKGNKIVLVVKDNGCGIKQSEIGRVFEKGFTGSNRKKENATGMGLYLVKRLSERLGMESWGRSWEKRKMEKGEMEFFEKN